MKHGIGLMAVLAALNLLWSPVNLMIVQAQAAMSPLAVPAARWTLFASLLWALLAFPGVRRRLQVVFPRGWAVAQALILGFCLVAPAHALYTISLQYTTSAETSVLNTTAPIWTALFALPLLGEAIPPRRWMAITLGFVGSVVVVSGLNFVSFGGGTATGNTLYLLGVIAECLAMIFAVRLIRHASGPGVLAFEATGAALAFLVLPVIFPNQLAISVGTLTPQAVLSVAYLVGVAGVFAFCVWYAVAESAPMSWMVVSLGLQAPMGAFLGWLILNDPITPPLILGTCIILVALFLASSEGNPSYAEELEAA